MLWNSIDEKIRRFSATEQKAIRQAFDRGEKAHEGQKRKSGDVYFTHPIAVANILIGWGADADTIIAALLHDTVEDTSVTLEEIAMEFGPAVAMLIDGVTKLDESDLGTHPTLNEQIETLRKMFRLMQSDVRIMVIKLADRLHNMQTIRFRNPEAQMRVAKETLDVHVKIADRLSMGQLRNDLEELCLSILEAERFPSLQKIRAENEETGKNVLLRMRSALGSPLSTLGTELLFEPKRWKKTRMQYELGGPVLRSQVSVTAAFICKNVEECYRMLGMLHHHWKREANTFEDYINNPMANGYKAIHTTVILEDGTRIRCKIRTLEMQHYADFGITTLCFGQDRENMMDRLPWTHNITSLSKDTEDRSQDFWDSLQSDILGESMVVYGPANQTGVVPRGASALDAVLYLFREQGLRASEIRVKGRIVPFSHRMEHGDVVDVVFAKKRMVEREWLHWVNTGIGVALIRSGLSSKSSDTLIEIGKRLLQQEFNRKGRGYIEEFDQAVLVRSMQSIGYTSPADAYIAIADGHLEPNIAFESMFQRSAKKSSSEESREERCMMRFHIDQSAETMRRLVHVYEKYAIHLHDIRMHQEEGNVARFACSLSLSPEAQEALRQDLIAIGAQKMSLTIHTPVEVGLMSIIVVFWALNPVIAKIFLLQGVGVLTLVSLRSIVFFLLSTLLFIGWRIRKPAMLMPVPRAFRLALIPAVATFILACLTYLSLSALPASVHLTILRFNVLLLPLFNLIIQKKFEQRNIFILGGTLFVLCISMFLLPVSHLPTLGIGYAILALFTYAFYSLTTERTMHTYRIGARYPYFLFHVGLTLGIIGTLLLPFQLNTLSVWQPLLVPIALYVFFCVFIPHTSLHILLQRSRFRHVTSMSLFEVPLAILFEVLLLGMVLSPVLYVLILLILAGFILLLRNKRLFE